jgi:hypothetical protein
MNDGISASCENVSAAPLKLAAEITSHMKHFKYIEKGENILVTGLQHMML